MSIEELLARPGLLLLVRSADSETVRELRQILGDLGTVVRIVGTTAAVVDEARDCVIDPDDGIGRSFGLGADGLALIRPDGYLGLVARPVEPNILQDHLRETLGVVQVFHHLSCR